MNPFLASVAAPVSWWPLVVLTVSILFIVVAITRLRMPAFLALILAAFLAGFMADGFSPAAIERLPAAMREDARANSWIAALELTAVEFGATAGSIAISIGLAAIIGLCLMESGGADKVVRRFLAAFGEKRAALALLASTYFLSIPIFFDTMFMLMVPIARALGLRTGRNYLLYIMAVCGAGVLTHSLTVPHPGPLAMVDNLRVDAGLSLFWGIVAGLLPGLIGYFFVKWLAARQTVPVREIAGVSLRDMEEISRRPESELPSFFWSAMPVLLPIVLIGLGSFFRVAAGYPAAMAWFGGEENFRAMGKVLLFVSNKNIALLVGAGIAMGVLARQRRLGFKQLGEMVETPLSTAAVIILITAAGGAFGGMLRHAGVGDAVKALALTHSLDLITLSWFTALVIRVAQGSATVAMLTTSAVIWPMIDPAANAPLAFNPMYVFLAIGFGAFAASWMNDSGFWVVSRLGGLTTRETLRSWSVLVTLVSFSGLMLTLLFSRVLPLG